MLPAFTAALHPVFLLAAGLAAIGFVLTWFLKELPLRKTSASEAIGDGFAMPRSATSLEELERIVARLIEKENRWRVYQDLAKAAGLTISAPELWLLVQLGEASSDWPVKLGSIGEADAKTLGRVASRLAAAGLVVLPTHSEARLTATGREAFAKVVDARQRSLAEVLANWKPEQHPEVIAVMRRYAEAITADMPHAAPAMAAE